MGGRPKIVMPPPPPPPPDYADQAVRQAAYAESQKAIGGSARRKSFVTGSGTAGTGAPPIGVKKLLGV